jgi:integrase
MPSRWFGRFKERCGIMEKHTKVFHSFRHTFISTLLNNDVPETAIAPIVGHEGMLVTSQVYWNVRDPVKRKPTVEKFQPHPEVWRLVPKFEDVEITGD